MKFKDLLKWNARVSAVYAIGIWTMVGSYAYLKYTGRCEVAPGERPHAKTVITYKKDFVPYTTRIYNLISSFSGDRGAGDDNK
uniref:Small integral membrane protein 26 n=1 Tax=Haplochromis burtoni TaxID=8153 RepID=A0A3Q2US47_HAPBU